MQVVWEEEDIKPGLKVQSLANNAVWLVTQEANNTYRFVQLAMAFCSQGYILKELLEELNRPDNTFIPFK